MSLSFNLLAKRIGLSDSELRKEILEMGFEIQEEYDEDTSSLIIDELTGRSDKSSTDAYIEKAEAEQEREIIRQQRKQKTKSAKKIVKKVENNTPKTVREGTVEIPEDISVKELAEKTGASAAVLIGELMKNGILANINQVIDFDTAVIITANLGVELKRKRNEASAEDIFMGNLEKLLKEEDPSFLQERPPVVCVMGHVDHGKTSLLDTIRSSAVASQEAGGITQHIGAYQVEKNGKLVTFLDTPGHEAFTAMRARGAKATDIAILVVAADDSVMPQTIEAIHHAKEANVPIIVAINKIDKESSNLDKVKAELAEHGLMPEEWGGETMMIPVSALKGTNIDQLIEAVLLTAEVMELKANKDRLGVATIIESHLDQNLGPVATVLVNTGTLSVGDNFVIGGGYGRVKKMTNHAGENVQTLLPSGTAQISGLQATVESGQILQVTKDEKTARSQAYKVDELHHETLIRSGMGMQEILQRIKEGSLKLLKLVLKADTEGSLEAIKQALSKVNSEDVAIKVIHSGVGNITESDVMMAAAAQGAMVIGFHTEMSTHVEKLAEKMGVEVVAYEVIYEIIEDMRKILLGMLEPEVLEIELGRFKVLKIFWTGKGEMVLGGQILDGKLQGKSFVRIMRKQEHLGDGEIIGLKLVNEEVKELEKGQECGIRFKGKFAVEEGDILEAWKREKKMKTL